MFVYDDATGRPLKRGDTLQGHPTVGVGRNLSERGLSRLEADLLFTHDVLEVTTSVIRAWPWMAALDEARLAVFVSLAFNVGLGGLRGFKRTLAHAQASEWSEAAYEMLDSRWADQVGDRAEQLATMLRLGAWPEE